MDDIDLPLVICIILTFGLAVGLFMFYNTFEQNNEITQIEKALSDSEEKKITSFEFKIYKMFERNRRTYLEEDLSKWDSNSADFMLLCSYATRFLILYNTDRAQEVYLTIAADVIHKLNDNIFQPKNYKIIQTNAGLTDFKVFIELTRLLNTFQYLADDTFVNIKDICREQILYLIPKYNKLYNDELTEDEKTIYTIIPRLLTTYLISDKKLWNKDVGINKVFTKLKEKFNILQTSQAELKTFILYEYHNALYKILKSLFKKVDIKSETS
ncbi:putative envelope protein ODV-E66-15 [Microplitis demolitor]|uniref:putative envelope protein ODV-E66-15 n=1 Tax=Microplitis demolitor TaxID=69319 RepID=UPI0004400353|nr:putative envelope protein ODV-E66-15 [Microplitis demolitor]KAG6558316.1 putative envelope protein ODV-E66-15 [Microplitis demolitor]